MADASRAARPAPIDVGALVAELARRIEDLCFELFPAGYADSGEFHIGSVAGEQGKSLCVCLNGSKAGVWADFASDAHKGDALDLIRFALYGGDPSSAGKGKAIRWAMDWLGWTAAPGGSPGHAPVQRPKPAPKKPQDDDESGTRRFAHRLWLDARPSLRGTPAERYLRSRGIDLAAMGSQPGALRFVPWLANKESGRSWPALVAAINGPDGTHLATHRTWLAEDGSGKAPLAEPRMTLGKYRGLGGTIRLARGISQKPLRDAPEGDHVVLTEGIEDGLTVAQACPWLRVLAAVSVSNMASVQLPPTITTVTIMADNDASGSKAAGALDKAIARFVSEKRSVRVARSPVGKDINDLLRSTMREGAA